MNTKINVHNEMAVNDILKAVQYRCRERMFDAEDIAGWAEDAEKKLNELKIPSSYRQNSQLVVLPPRMPNSYKYPAEGTFVLLVRGKKSWFLRNAGRTNTGSISRGESNPRTHLTLSKKAIESKVNWLKAGFSV